MSLDYYNAQEKPWVSPRLVLIYYDRILKIFGDNIFTSSDFRKVIEAKVVALTLLGVHKGNGGHFLMQVPVAVNESPDIVTMKLKEYLDKPVQMEMQDVEVVEYGEKSQEDISTFLIKEKLDPKQSKKAYDDKTIIICHITKNKVVVSHPDLHQKIKTVNPKAKVYLLGQVPHPTKRYRLIRVWPQLDSLIYIDVVNDGNNYPKPDSLKLSLGTNKKIVIGKSDMPLPTPYEVFELDEERLKKKFL